jgi:activating signal cointegrator 1
MKIITVEQPWATLIAAGIKQMETRPENTSYRGPLAIQAGNNPEPVKDPYIRSVLSHAGYAFDNPPRDLLLAECELVDCREITNARCPCYPEYAFGNFRPGWYAWILANVRQTDDFQFSHLGCAKQEQ